MQRFKEVSQMDLVQSFPLLLSGYHLCWVINFYAFVGCSSVQLTYSYFCKTSINLQPAKQGLFSVTSGIVYSSRLHELCLNFAVQIF